MKTISRMMMTIVLLVVALTASAQKHSQTMKNPLTGNEISYTLSGGEFSLIGGVHTATTNPYITWQEVKGIATVGTTISGSIKRIKGPKDRDAKDMGPLRIYYTSYNGDKVVTKSSNNGTTSTSISYTIPKGVTKVTMTMLYWIGGRDGRISCEVKWDVVKAPKKNEAKSSYLGYCPHCHHKDSEIRFNDFYGEVKIRCKFEEDDSYEFVDLDTEIFEYDLISTEEESGAILGLEDMSTYIIYPDTKLIIHPDDVNVSKLEMLVGSLVGNIKKMIKGESLEIEMTQIAMGINGTIFAVKETGSQSSVWLFAGDVDVKSKKTGKKTKLQPGQRSITGKDGVIQVKSFNIEEGAKKFGIKMSDINNHYSNKNNASAKGKNDRYNVKCAVVKYKYTKGKVTGQHERAFDNYGKLERRTFKTASTETISYYRDKKVYNLDVKKKTMTVKTDNQLNFGNPDAPNIKKMRKSGSATILGKSCAIYQSGKTDYYVWKGIVLKKVEHLKDGSVATTVATSIQQPSSLNASMFEVPKGYKTK